MIVDNRPGLAGTAAVAKAAPDGYTLLVGSNGHTIAPVVNKSRRVGLDLEAIARYGKMMRDAGLAVN